jgi:hypothetical protein
MTIASDIISGVYDSELDSIQHAVPERRELAQAEMAANNLIEISIGDKIVFKDIRPKYMNGYIATVTGKRKKKLEVKLHLPDGTYMTHRNRIDRVFHGAGYGGQFFVPACCVEKAA